MGEDLGVGFGTKGIVTVLNELLLERVVVFDDAVMNERNLAGGVVVRVRVLVIDLAVGGPPRVTDSEATARRFLRHQLGQVANSSGALPRLNIFAVDDSDSGGIVSAIFKAAEAVQEDGSRFRTTDVTDNSAHI